MDTHHHSPHLKGTGMVVMESSFFLLQSWTPTEWGLCLARRITPLLLAPRHSASSGLGRSLCLAFWIRSS